MWKSIGVAARELNLNLTLPSGQSFRWSKVGKDEWIGIVNRNVVLLRHSASGEVEYKLLCCEEKSSRKIVHELRDYFRLEVKTENLYNDWAKKDLNFSRRLAQLGSGLRILNLCPVETTISTICTANNNVPRITKMLEALCKTYGKMVCTHKGVELYTFPSLELLAQKDTEENLRNLGFGYRAKYITRASAELLRLGGINWLNSLKGSDYYTARKLIMSLPGVGPKVADCILLFSLRYDEAFPLDTHILNVAKIDYNFNYGQCLTLTCKTYLEISDRFRALFGPMAGWAQCVLFARELNSRYNFNRVGEPQLDVPKNAQKRKRKILSIE